MERARCAIRLCDIKIPTKELLHQACGLPLGMLVIFDGSRRLAHLFPVFESQTFLSIVVEWKAFQKATGITSSFDAHKTVIDFVKAKNDDKLALKLVVFEPKLATILLPIYPIVTVNNKRLVPLDGTTMANKSIDGDNIVETLRDMIEVFGWFDIA